MRNPVKRTITLALTLAVLFAIAASGAVAAPAPATATAVSSSTSGKGMETAIRAVKELIPIDESLFTDFSYSSTVSNQQTREGLVWNFNWSDLENSYIYAYVQDDGTVLQLRRYEYGKSTFGFAGVTRSDAAAIAMELLRRAAPEIFDYYSQKGEPEISINNEEYTFNYVAEVNGHEFDAATASVGVDKFSGDITSYYTSNMNPKNYTFESAAKTISTDAAVSAYADKLGLTLEYRSYYDYNANKLTIFPAYQMNTYGDKFISAVTGDVVTYVYDRGMDDGAKNASAPQAMSETAADSGTGGSARLSPQEIAAVEKARNFITSDKALENLLAIMELPDVDTASFGETYVYLNKDYVNRDRYIYDIGMYSNDPAARSDGISYISGRVDAETGRVLSFSYNSKIMMSPNMSQGNAKLVTEAQATETVNKFLNANAPEELKKSKLDSVQAPAEDRYDSQLYYFNYYRVENGVPFRNNGINITLDALTGKITSYSLNWYLNATFPSVANVLTPEKALAGYVAQNSARTNYITAGNGKVSLVYDFGYGLIDPFTGKAVDYSGEKQEPNTITPDYSDVKGHWSERYVNKLLENGVYAWGGKFEPGRVMTQLEFLEYLMELEPWYQAEPLQYFRDRNIKADIKADDKTPVTRQEAARIIIEYLGYGKLAEKYKWFAYPFTGAVDEAYKGYITACCALGIINGTGGEYNAKQGVTRAEAAVMLHNLILAKSEG